MYLSDEIKKELVDRIKLVISPEKVILFGSYANRKATAENNIDILIVEKEVKSKIEEKRKVRKSLSAVDIPKDILVVSEEEFNFYKNEFGSVIKEAYDKSMEYMKNIYIIGAGGHAKVIADIILKRKELLNEKLELMGFFDDKEDKSELIFGKPILGNIGEVEKIRQSENTYFIIGIGNNKIRKLISEKYKLNYYIAIHPNSIIGNEVKLGTGTVVMAGVIINSYTFIEKHSVINTGAIIDHECNIASYSHICPRVAIAGNVKVGQETWVGIGSTVKQGVKIGNNVMIGAGSLVLKNIEDRKLAYGHPCSEIGENNV